MFSSTEIIAKVLPVLLLIGLGSYLRRVNFLAPAAVKNMKDLVVNIALPSLLFLAFSGVEFEIRYFAVFLTVFGVCLVMMLIGRLLGTTLKVDSPYFGLTFTGFEAGMLGYSVFVAIFGVENTFKFAVIDLGQVTFVFFILVGYLIKLRDGIEEFGTLFKSFITSPVIIGIFLGIVAGSSGIIPALRDNFITSAVLQVVDFLSRLTVPLILLVIGYELRVDFKKARLPMLAVGLRAAILLVVALIVKELVIARFLGLDRIFQMALLVMFILPPPFVMPLFMPEDDEANRQFVLNTLSLHTLVTLGLLIVVMLVFA